MSVRSQLNAKLNTRWRRYLFVPFAIYTLYVLALSGWFIFYSFVQPQERWRGNGEPSVMLSSKAEECASKYPGFKVSRFDYDSFVDRDQRGMNLLKTNRPEGIAFRECLSPSDAYVPNPDYSRTRYISYGNGADGEDFLTVAAFWLPWLFLFVVLIPPHWARNFWGWLNMKDRS